MHTFISQKKRNKIYLQNYVIPVNKKKSAFKKYARFGKKL